MNRVAPTSRNTDLVDEELARIAGASWSEGNRIHVLENGDEIFPAMLSAIEKAEKDIRFLTYVYWEGEIAWKFARALAARARAGVSCLVLLDAHGAFRISRKLLDELQDAGVFVARFNPFQWNDPLRYQHRTHRKILLCDGEVGFIGGVGIADEWMGNAQTPQERHDFHFQVEGPSLDALNAAFLENWESPWTAPLSAETAETEATILPSGSERTSTPESHSGCQSDMNVLPLLSSPLAKRSEAHHAFSMMMRSARSSVKIVSAYLIPDSEMIALFRETVARGVDISLVIPGQHRDSWLAQSRSRARWGEMLQAGVKLNLYEPTMCHAKFAIFDEELVTIGSINFDLLSFRLNEEANLIVRSRSFAELMIEKFEQDRSKSTPLSLEKFQERSLWKRAKERLAEWFPLPYWCRDCHY